MAGSKLSPLRVAGSTFINGDGESVVLRGAALGGWLNMENFITGYSANESLMRHEMRAVLGTERYERLFERLLTAFFGEHDASFLGSIGLNSVRIPVNYRHLEDDSRPFVVKEDGFRHLDRAIELCAAQGIYSVIDLHALPGYQNHHWHCDNPTHVASLWEHPHFQDRTVHIWEAIADRYKGNPAVAGYNPMNEPADESRAVIGPFYERLIGAIRAVDPDHVLFLDGNTYSTEFDIFGEPTDNTVYVCHDYVAAGLGYGGSYPGYTRGVWHDRESAEEKFLLRTEFSRKTGTPVWVGEFGPTYTRDVETNRQRQQILEDQLDLYGHHRASWCLWTYKDIGRQGLVSLRADTPYRHLVDAFVAKKERLAADAWGSDAEGPVEVSRPVQDLVANEIPGFDPYPWGRWDWVRTLLLTITVAQPLVGEYAKLFAGLGDDELDALADSFAFSSCEVREPLRSQLAAACS